MKVTAPVLLPLLRSQAQGEILAWVFLTPGAHSIADIARATGVPEATVLREIDRLVATGFATERRQGRNRLIEPDPKNPATPPLTALLAITFGPTFVLRERLAHLDGIAYAAIYGSWAARAAGAAGPPPADIDLLVVGQASQAAVYEAAEDASALLRRPVNATVIDQATWLDGHDPFVSTVRQRPLIPLIDNLDTHERN
jgi:DNA-binding transcriptional ArsR family regulator